MADDGSLEASSITVKDPKTPAENVKLWQERVSIARQSGENWAKSSGAERFVDEYNGKFSIFFNGLKGAIPVPPINEIFAYVNADLAMTYNRDPYISVNPKAGTVQGAKIWEVVLNYYWRHLRTKDEVEPELIDKDLVGFGWHKVGWEVETDGAQEEMRIVKEGLYSGRVDWKDVVWNFGAKKAPYDCLWMAQRIVKPLMYVKEKYPAAKDLEGTQDPSVDKNSYDNASFKDDIKVAVLWEVWDAMTRQVYLLAEGLNDKFLAPARPWPDYMSEFPFLMYWDFYAPGKPRPMSSIAPWEPQVLEKMILLASAINHSKRWNRQVLIRKGAMSEGDLDKFERGDDGAILDYTGTGELDSNLKVFDWGTLPVDFYLLMDRLSGIERDVNGQPEFERGGVTKTSTRTEGELQLIQAGAKGRSDRRVDRFETHLENIARHMLMHLKGNFDFEETIRITGETPEDVIAALGDHFDPVTRTVTFTAQDIEGDYDVEVKAGSTLPLNRETKTQILQMILQTLGNVQENGVSPLLRAVISELLDEFDMKSLEEAYQQEQQAQDQNAQAQAASAQATDIKNKSQAAKNVASADKIGAEADKTRLQIHPGSVITQQERMMAGAGAPEGGAPNGLR